MGSGLAQDIRLAVRGLLRSRLVSIVAILTLAIAIGANTAVFSLINSLLIRPLPVVDPNRLVWISSEYAIAHGFTAGAGWNAAMWDELRVRSGPFGGALAWRFDRATIGRSGEIERAWSPSSAIVCGSGGSRARRPSSGHPSRSKACRSRSSA